MCYISKIVRTMSLPLHLQLYASTSTLPPAGIKTPPPRLAALHGGCLVLAEGWARQVM